MMNVLIFLTLAFFSAFVFNMSLALNIQENWWPLYKSYKMQVNQTGIAYDYHRFPCFQRNARCLIVHDFPGSGENYDIEVLGNSTSTCSRKYQIDQGKESQKTIYSGECFSTTNTQYLVTCRDPKQFDGEPDHFLGWAVVNLNDTISEAWAYEGAKINMVDSNGWSDHSISTQANVQVLVRCPADPTPLKIVN